MYLEHFSWCTDRDTGSDPTETAPWGPKHVAVAVV